MVKMGDDISPFQTQAVQENALKSLPCPTTAIHELEDDEHDGPSSISPDVLTSDQIPNAFSAAKDDNLVKATVRSQCMHFKSPLRSVMWKCIYLRMEALASSTTDPLNAASLAEATAGLFRDTLLTCFGSLDFPKSTDEVNLPSCIDPNHVNSYFLNSHGKISVSRILTCFAYNQPDLQYCPMLYPIASILRHYLSEEDTYGFLSIMASAKRSKYLFLSKLQLEVASLTAYELTKKYSRKHLLFIEASGTQEEIMGLFNDWIWWIFDRLPFPHAVRVIDSYLMEGYKVFYRVGFALVRYFARFVRSGNSKWSGIIESRGLKGAFLYFCKEIPVTPDALMEKGFKIRGFSRANIEKTYLRTDVDLKARGLLASSGSRKTRSQSQDNLPTPDAMNKINATSTTLTYKEGMSTPQPRTKLLAAPIHHLKSELLKKSDLITIWHWLPERMTMANPELVYSSNEHGISLTTFYARSEKYEPTILVIKTIQGDIFGAYCSTTWAARNLKDDMGRRQHYFGTGETFLFTFANGPPTRYTWVNANKTDAETTDTKAEEHQKELFMCGRPDMVAIGGGNGNGIFLDPTLTHGKTEHCATFNNPPLCKSGDFQISAIEVYGLFHYDI